MVDETLVVGGSMRRDALLVALLEMALERLGPDASEQMAHDVGVDYGRTLGAAVGSDRLSPDGQRGHDLDRGTTHRARL